MLRVRKVKYGKRRFSGGRHGMIEGGRRLSLPSFSHWAGRAADACSACAFWGGAGYSGAHYGARLLRARAPLRLRRRRAWRISAAFLCPPRFCAEILSALPLLDACVTTAGGARRAGAGTPSVFAALSSSICGRTFEHPTSLACGALVGALSAEHLVSGLLLLQDAGAPASPAYRDLARSLPRDLHLLSPHLCVSILLLAARRGKTS